MNAIISVTGRDSVGIISAVSNECTANKVNILDISQTVLKEYFVMIMLVDMEGMSVPFTDFVDKMKKLGESKGLVIQTMHEDIFNAMHKI